MTCYALETNYFHRVDHRCNRQIENGNQLSFDMWLTLVLFVLTVATWKMIKTRVDNFSNPVLHIISQEDGTMILCMRYRTPCLKNMSISAICLETGSNRVDILSHALPIPSIPGIHQLQLQATGDFQLTTSPPPLATSHFVSVQISFPKGMEEGHKLTIDQVARLYLGLVIKSTKRLAL